MQLRMEISARRYTEIGLLRYDGSVSKFAFNFNLRCYNPVDTSTFFMQFCLLRVAQSCPLELIHPPFHLGFVVKTMVGWCRLKPVYLSVFLQARNQTSFALGH